MNNIIKKIFVFIALVLSCYLVNVKADNLTPSSDSKYDWHDYVIDKYDIDIKVNENNTFDITEEITAHFNVPKHGIYRTIPIKNTVKRLDGTTSKNYARITNLSVDNEYTEEKENGNYKLKIGSEDKTITGNQKYVIKYTYNIGKDPLKDKDEFYFNLIGTDWDTVIGNITFKITMPKEFDSSKLGFSSGIASSVDSSKIIYDVDGNIISGRYNGILNSKEALTVRLELSEGYFVGAGYKMNFFDYIMFIIPILFLIVSILLWYKYGRDEKVVETVEFNPPDGLNSLDVGFLYKGTTNNKDVVSLLIYLANKGYIKIEEIKKKSLFNKQDFKITKLKEYDGSDENEHIFLYGLFSKEDKIDSKKIKDLIKASKKAGVKMSYSEAYEKAFFGTTVEEHNSVTLSDLYNNFYKTINQIIANMTAKKDEIFEKIPLKLICLMNLLIIISSLSMIIISTFEETGIESGVDWVILISILIINSIVCIPIMAIVSVIEYSFNSRIKIILAMVFFLSYKIYAFNSFSLQELMFCNPVHLIGFIIGMICELGIIIFCSLLSKRTKYGNEMLGKIKGFKTFLETAEKDKLESMVNDNPTYFYDILPYAYVLGVSDKWIKKFETISMKAPSWYVGYDAFDMHTFSSFITTAMTSAQSAMTSSPSSDSGSSGGGSSGGGSGGGGGGSW